MHLSFVRHGERGAHSNHVFTNHGFQHPLTPTGIAQAETRAAHLASCAITHISTSPLQRAVQTAEILAQVLGIGVITTPTLRDWDGGHLGRHGRPKRLGHAS